MMRREQVHVGERGTLVGTIGEVAGQASSGRARSPQASRWLAGGLLVALAILAPVAVGCGGSGAAEGESSGEAGVYPTPAMRRVTADAANVSYLRELLAESSGPATAAAGPAKAVENDGWADIVGLVKLNGDPPAQNSLDVTKDKEVCAPGGGVVLDQTIVVGPDKGLANLLVFVSSKVSDNWEHEDHKAARNQELTGDLAFDQKNCIFLPHVFAFRSSQRLQILNSDPIGHNTNISEFGFNETIGANDATYFEAGRETRSPFQVRCSIHPWMKAWMITRNNPYFAVTKSDGSFTIPKVPAGVELEFKIWHERSKLDSFTLNGSQAGGGEFTVTLQKDKPFELNLVVDASQFDN